MTTLQVVRTSFLGPRPRLFPLVKHERKQAKRSEFLPRERLVQGEKHAGKEVLLGVLDPTFTVSKTLQQRNAIPNSAGTKKLKAKNMLKATPPTIGTGHCPFSLYTLFIASKHMSSQRAIFLLGKDKLINIKLTVFFILP